MVPIRNTASTSATRLQYQYIGPFPWSWWVSLAGRKISSVSVIFATVPKSHRSTAKEITPGRTMARPAQKLACQRAKIFFFTPPA